MRDPAAASSRAPKKTVLSAIFCVAQGKARRMEAAGRGEIRVMYRVINCDAHTERLAQFRRRARRAGLPPVPRQKCVNGKRLTRERLCGMVRRGVLAPRAAITPVEAAIGLSHRRCWRALARSRRATHLVVFEDDCRVRRDFVARLRALLGAGLGFDLLLLYNGNWQGTRGQREKVATVRGMEVWREGAPAFNAGAACYCVSRSYAQRLLRRQLPMREAVDQFMGGPRVASRRRLTVDTVPDRRLATRCYTTSPLLWVPCPYEGGDQSTQDYKAQTVRDHRCLAAGGCVEGWCQKKIARSKDRDGRAAQQEGGLCERERR